MPANSPTTSVLIRSDSYLPFLDSPWLLPLLLSELFRSFFLATHIFRRQLAHSIAADRLYPEASLIDVTSNHVEKKSGFLGT